MLSLTTALGGPCRGAGASGTAAVQWQCRLQRLVVLMRVVFIPRRLPSPFGLGSSTGSPTRGEVVEDAREVAHD
eukprot:14929490-Heterocapsa_arctica.AAC.1